MKLISIILLFYLLDSSQVNGQSLNDTLYIKHRFLRGNWFMQQNIPIKLKKTETLCKDLPETKLLFENIRHARITKFTSGIGSVIILSIGIGAVLADQSTATSTTLIATGILVYIGKIEMESLEEKEMKEVARLYNLSLRH